MAAFSARNSRVSRDWRDRLIACDPRAKIGAGVPGYVGSGHGADLAIPLLGGIVDCNPDLLHRVPLLRDSQPVAAIAMDRQKARATDHWLVDVDGVFGHAFGLWVNRADMACL